MKRAACLLLALAAAAAGAQTPPRPAASGTVPGTVHCPTPEKTEARDLFGLWRAEMEGEQQPFTVLFEKHPEIDDRVYGGINRLGQQALLAGDVDDGVLTLDESDDGLQISAVWSGNVLPNSCGKEIRGTWTNLKTDKDSGFVLRKAPGWR
ncbi:MAG: hypothetical protein ABW051_06120 [Burkholderiaceae bacterium]